MHLLKKIVLTALCLAPLSFTSCNKEEKKVEEALDHVVDKEAQAFSWGVDPTDN